MGGIGQAIRYAVSSQQFTEIKQVSACSSQVCWDIKAWNTFVLRVEDPYIVRESEKSLDMGEPTSMMRSSSAGNYSQKLHKKDSIKPVVHGVSLSIASSDC